MARAEPGGSRSRPAVVLPPGKERVHSGVGRREKQGLLRRDECLLSCLRIACRRFCSTEAWRGRRRRRHCYVSFKKTNDSLIEDESKTTGCGGIFTSARDVDKDVCLLDVITVKSSQLCSMCSTQMNSE